jgi:hypothetical protein
VSDFSDCAFTMQGSALRQNPDGTISMIPTDASYVKQMPDGSTAVLYGEDAPAPNEPPSGQRPHRCPVCEGRQFVPGGFYIGGSATSANPETCRTCKGAGVLWR